MTQAAEKLLENAQAFGGIEISFRSFRLKTCSYTQIGQAPAQQNALEERRGSNRSYKTSISAPIRDAAARKQMDKLH